MKQGSVIGLAFLLFLCLVGVGWLALSADPTKPQVIEVEGTVPDYAPAAAVAPGTGGVDALDSGLP